MLYGCVNRPRQLDGLRISGLHFGPLVTPPRSSFNFKLSTFDSISLTPFSSAPSALSQKLYFPQTISNLRLAHSFAKHRGVGGRRFQSAAGFSPAQSVALQLTFSYRLRHSTFDVRLASCRPSFRWRTANSNPIIHFRTLSACPACPESRRELRGIATETRLHRRGPPPPPHFSERCDSKQVTREGLQKM